VARLVLLDNPRRIFRRDGSDGAAPI